MGREYVIRCDNKATCKNVVDAPPPKRGRRPTDGIPDEWIVLLQGDTEPKTFCSITCNAEWAVEQTPREARRVVPMAKPT